MKIEITKEERSQAQNTPIHGNLTSNKMAGILDMMLWPDNLSDDVKTQFYETLRYAQHAIAYCANMYFLEKKNKELNNENY